MDMKLLTKQKQTLAYISALGAFALLSGCATDIGGGQYSENSVGEVSQTYRATVLKIRQVKVSPDSLGKSWVGTAFGGVTGAAVANTVDASPIGSVGLIGAGALGGAMIEKKLKTQDALEITLTLKDGDLRTVVQGNDIQFKKDEKVFLMTYYGGRSKVVKESDL